MENARSLYKNDVDFAALALQSRDFAKYLKPKSQLDFSDPAAVRQLTTSLLEQDFHLKVEIPDDRLCPPVCTYINQRRSHAHALTLLAGTKQVCRRRVDTNVTPLCMTDEKERLNYILWLQDLLDSTTGELKSGYDSSREVVGLDIGTGCISIYPLLGCTSRPGWTFIATDIDSNNIYSAQHNVQMNKLEHRIRVINTDAEGLLFPLNNLGHATLDFTMCNPPFYTSRDELIQSAEQKSRPAFSACTGAEVEMVTRGGEVAFVKRMIEESLVLHDRIQWYTSMLGKLSSVSVLVEMLIQHDNHNYAVTEFVQGSKTKRWALAWSWGDKRPIMTAARGIPGFPKHLLPFPADYNFTLAPEISIDTASAALNSELDSLTWFWSWDQNASAGTGIAAENVWSRQARRKMKISGQEGAGKLKDVPTQVHLGVRVYLRLLRGQKPEDKKVQVLVRWTQGTDSVLFESFCGMVKRKLEAK
ncbi:uncharacterized protein N7511_000753 [Penicillium nucicola]|uniref:uncharacterized protein n=1 Tax=Penicillium nucicola TaxID=1850975 RepID=UPI0025458DB6|nr:uncharacterized protein N7511_000753 [Penicillium nucicola]KAJ5775742.1 hypothetical protein N7511_000753 [Penicillium nucicola]